MTVDWDKMGSSLAEWIVELEGAEESLYCGEKFKLQFKFGQRYPFESPQVRNQHLIENSNMYPNSSNRKICNLAIGRCFTRKAAIK